MAAWSYKPARTAASGLGDAIDWRALSAFPFYLENDMTPEQFIKLAILQTTARWDNAELQSDLSPDEVEERYDALVEQDAHWDARSEVREGDVETNIEPDYSRHYESKSVATQVNGQWVGWTYWYGGGKHGEPEAIDWMDQAYFLDCVEEQKTVTIRTFSKPETPTA